MVFVSEFKSTCLYAIYIKATFKAIDFNCWLCICKLSTPRGHGAHCLQSSRLDLDFYRTRHAQRTPSNYSGRLKLDLRRRWNIHLAQISGVWILLYFISTIIYHRLRLDLLADTRFRFLELLKLDGKHAIFLSSYFIWVIASIIAYMRKLYSIRR